MKTNTTLAMIAVSLAASFAPGLALAEGGCHSMKSKAESASSCVPGSTWDETKATCVATPSS